MRNLIPLLITVALVPALAPAADPPKPTKDDMPYYVPSWKPSTSGRVLGAVAQHPLHLTGDHGVWVAIHCNPEGPRVRIALANPGTEAQVPRARVVVSVDTLQVASLDAPDPDHIWIEDAKWFTDLLGTSEVLRLRIDESYARYVVQYPLAGFRDAWDQSECAKR